MAIVCDHGKVLLEGAAMCPKCEHEDLVANGPGGTNHEAPPGGGTKHDGGKPPMALLPGHVLAQVAAVLANGADRYGADNWREGIPQRRLISAALRHVLAYNDGQNYDPDTGRSHLAHAMCMLIFAEELRVTRSDLDDRYAVSVPEGLSEVYRGR